MKYEDARGVCEADGANLPIIKDEDTQNVLSAKNQNNDEAMWIGLEFYSFKWLWQLGNGEKEYLNTEIAFWQPGEPNNLGFKFCAVSNASGWMHVDCDSTYNFACQKPKPGAKRLYQNRRF